MCCSRRGRGKRRMLCPFLAASAPLLSISQSLRRVCSRQGAILVPAGNIKNHKANEVHPQWIYSLVGETRHIKKDELRNKTGYGQCQWVLLLKSNENSEEKNTAEHVEVIRNGGDTCRKGEYSRPGGVGVKSEKVQDISISNLSNIKEPLPCENQRIQYNGVVKRAGSEPKLVDWNPSLDWYRQGPQRQVIQLHKPQFPHVCAGCCHRRWGYSCEWQKSHS